MRITITTPLWHGTRTGTARPAFGKGRYHVTLDGETETRSECRLDCEAAHRHVSRARELLFTRDELAREDGGRL